MGGIAELLQPAGVGGGDFLHHVQPVQQVRKVVGLEENLPIADGSLFLHGLNPGLAVGVELVEPGLGGIQLLLLVGNQHTVGGNLLIDIDNLRMEQTNLLVNYVLPGHNAGNLVGGGIVLSLELSNLIFDILAVFLQGIDLLTNLAGGGRRRPHGQDTENQRQQQHGSHYARQKRN